MLLGIQPACLVSSHSSLCSLRMWTSIGHRLSTYSCPERWWGDKRSLTLTLPVGELSVGSWKCPKKMVKRCKGPMMVTSLDAQKFDRCEEKESMTVRFGRLGSGAAGVLLGVALLLSNAEMGHASATVQSLEQMVAMGDGRVSSLEQMGVMDDDPEFPHISLLQSWKKSSPELLQHHRSHPVGFHARETLPGMPVTSRKSAPANSSVKLTRREAVHEGFGESLANNYGQIVRGHDDMEQRKAMFTMDAWAGMNRLKQYGEFVDMLETQEKMCRECTQNRRLLEQVWQTVSNEYFDQYGSFSQSKWAGELYYTLSKAGGLLQTKAQTYNAIKGMVKRLGDRYSAFLGPQQYRLAIRRPIPSEIKYLTYQYTGVGVELGKSSATGVLTVIAPFAGSPAEEAGVLSGERLLGIDGNTVDSLSPDEAVVLLRGPVGSMVELELSGVEPGSPVRSVLLERRALPLPPLRVRMVDAGDGRVLEYLRLHYFTHEGTKKMASAIRQGEALGVDGYILDLRNNPGGVFEEAIAMAALWLDCKGCDVTETVRTTEVDLEDLVYSVNNLPKEVFENNPGTLTHAPLAIITNRNSASASEVLTGALRDNQRAAVIGEKTFGKGVVQYYFPMEDGSGLKLTVAKFLTPSRYDISKEGGLEPDTLCNDYPHEQGRSDKCIEEALALLATQQEAKSGQSHSVPLSYRWLPLSERRLWASESY